MNYRQKIIEMISHTENRRFVDSPFVDSPADTYVCCQYSRGGNGMNEEKFYRESIVKMAFSIRNVEWLRKIYSFAKVFADDKEGSV